MFITRIFSIASNGLAEIASRRCILAWVAFLNILLLPDPPEKSPSDFSCDVSIRAQVISRCNPFADALLHSTDFFRYLGHVVRELSKPLYYYKRRTRRRDRRARINSYFPIQMVFENYFNNWQSRTWIFIILFAVCVAFSVTLLNTLVNCFA